ncbi:hypothetical protein P0082_08220 [Candidatus Haliotispira prima]|uniref:Uncharacterized protein n=1 Tax=Candidatus Haliotispira prima TaxID=3034016 RepID=A0ABY8MEY7_9SPIO|nr:hypothetical protein P0082_08220 [Candidatus Haliotispira prima]
MKLRANEYCACIGFSDNKAVVNKRAARQYKGYTVARFLGEGLYRQAFSLAYYDSDEERMAEVLQALQEKIANQGEPLPGRSVLRTVEDLVRLFGNIPAPQYLSGVLYV